MIGAEGHSFVEEEIDYSSIMTYVFSNHNNTDLMKLHNKNGNVWRRLYEIIFTSNENSLLSYSLDDNDNVAFNYLRSEIRDDNIVSDIHRGICDFCKDFNALEKNLNVDFEITGRDAYAPLKNAFSDKDYNYELFKDFEVCFIAGNVKIENAELFSDVALKGK